MSGPLIRLVAQVVVMGVGVVGRALVTAVQRVQADGGKAAMAAAANASKRGVMSTAQARQVLNLGEGEITGEQVLAQFERYFEANDPDKGGSFYLQSKIHNAKEALLDELDYVEPEPVVEEEAGAGGAGEGADADSSEDIVEDTVRGESGDGKRR